jgi:hypothetical protein
MAWKFDLTSVDLVWVETIDMAMNTGNLDFGSGTDSDMSVDMGTRTNDSSVIDSGLRVL